MPSTNPINAANPYNSAIVRASAGVGKTYLLVTRLIRLLLLDVRPDSILAITFTRKAAAEMQTRLFDRLFTLATAEDHVIEQELSQIGVENSSANIEKAKSLYESLLRNEYQVKTSTFHAFCQDILRKFPLEAEVPPGFELLDDEPGYRAIAWDALYDKATAEPNGAVAQALETLFDLTGGLHNTHQALDGFLNQRSEWWSFTLEQHEPVEYAKETLLHTLDVDLEIDPYEAIFNEQRQEELNQVARLLAKHDTATNLKVVDKLHKLTLSGIFSPSDNGNQADDNLTPAFSTLRDIFFKKDGDDKYVKPVKARQKKMGDDGEQEFLSLCESICRRLNHATRLANEQHNYYLNAAWYTAGQALLKEFQTIKLQQRLLDFTDLEWKTYVLLNHAENASWIQYKLDQRINHLLIDEFQDTNPTQWRLLSPLLSEFNEQQDRLRSVFLVGDEKQSIYGFRRANPKLLTTASEWLQTHLQASVYPMDKSRRSAPPVMQLVNHVFESPQLSSLALNFQHHSTFLDDENGDIHLLPLVTPDEKNVEAVFFRNPLIEPLIPAERLYYQEGQLIADNIQQLFANKTVINASGKNRYLNYGDIMLLIRSRTHLSDYEAAFREAGIPYLSNNRGTMFACQEIKDLIALLEILYTPYNNLALATVLRSPIFGCSNDDLTELASIVDKTSWFEALTSQTNDIQSENLRQASKSILSWRAIAGKLPVHDMLDIIFTDANIYQRYQNSVPKHFRNRISANLTQFLSLALSVDSGRYPSLGRFVARLYNLKQLDASPDEAVASDADSSVRILTIHAAKGLEAPVVFLADAADEKRAKSHAHSPVIDWPDDADRPASFLLCARKDKQIDLVDSLLQQENKKNDIENANLLYVALTRARQSLYISGCTKKTDTYPGWYGLIQQNWPENDLCQQSKKIIEIENNEADVIRIQHNDLPALFKHIILTEDVDDKTSSETVINLPIEHSTDSPEEPIIEDDKAQQRGILIHRAIEILCKYPDASKSEIYAQLANEFNLDKDNDIFLEFMNEALQTFNHPDFVNIFHCSENTKYYNEMPMQLRTNKGLKQGIIDRLLVSDDKIIIVDYKTHHSLDESNLQIEAEQFIKQMFLYCETVKCLWPNHSIQCVILFTHYSRLIDLTTAVNTYEPIIN